MYIRNKKFLVPFIIVAAISFMPAFIFANSVILPAPPQLAAKSYILIDSDTGKVIVEHNADTPLAPASLTKMMTSYIVSEEIIQGRLKEADLVRISDNAWKKGGAKSGGSTMFLDPRTKVSVLELLKGVVVQSGNDAAIALAEHLAGGEAAFADVMNQQAQMLGMVNSRFENSTGWPASGHVSTARDMARLAQASIQKHPEHYKIYAQESFKYNGISQPNRNKLLYRDKSVDGLKTGYTRDAGYCLVSSAKRDGMRLIAVVMGAPSEGARVKESQKLLSYGFRYFKTHTLYSAGDVISQKRIWSGDVDNIDLIVEQDVVVTIPSGSQKIVQAESRVDKIIKAPIVQGQKLGELAIVLRGEEITTSPIIAADAVAQAGFFARIWDVVLLKFEEF